MFLKSVNPATGQLNREFPEMPLAEVFNIIDKSSRDFEQWRCRPLMERADCFRTLAKLLRENSQQYAETITREMGKPIREAVAECEKCALVCEYYADHAAGFLQDEEIRTGTQKSFVTFQPLGLVLAIMPWNFPFWQVFRAAVPIMMAGNGVLLKHASSVPECALTLEALFHRAGFPLHVFRTLLISSRETAVVIAHEAVQAITLTGSTAAGENVAALAGTRIKKTVLELGGNDPYLVLEDADLDLAVQACIAGKMLNNGQSCIAVKRVVVLESVRKDFEGRLLKALRDYVPGDPMDGNCRCGPMAREDLRDELHGQVRKSVEAGANLLLGGTVPDRPGAWYPPTVLSGVRPGMPAYDEECFGPVLSIVSAEDEAEAVRIANDSSYGLGAGIFSRDEERVLRLAREELQAGTVAINDFVKSDPRLPFGGIKQSGYGRELGSFGIREFVNIKTVVLRGYP